MKALSFLSARLAIFGLCLIAALAAACSFDTSQLRPLADGAVEHPTVSDAAASGSGGSTASPPDAPTATGGSGGSSVTPSGGTTRTGGTTYTPTGGTIYTPTGGTVTLTGGTIYYPTGGTVTFTGGTIYNPTGGTIRTGGTGAPTGGTIYNPTGGTVTPTGGTIYNPTGGTIRTGGTVTPTGGTVTPTGGTIPTSTGGATPTCTPVPKSRGGIACPGGFCTVGTYSGADFSFADPTGKSSVCAPASSLCGAGTVGAQNPPNYTVWGAGFGFNLSPQTVGTAVVPVQLSGTGVTVTLTSLPTGADMRVQVAVGGVDYCAVMSAATQIIPWTAFNTKCWAPSTGTALTGAPKTPNIQFQASSRTTAGSFDFCVTALSFQ